MAILDIKPQSSNEPQTVAPKKESILLKIFVISAITFPIVISLWAVVSFYFASVLSAGNPSPQDAQHVLTISRVINTSLTLLGLAALGGLIFVPIIAVVNELIRFFTRKNK
ncbi:MAG: hypothetical protein KC585_02495 [Candidatus Magasanikbacteria bacterium]|nr:hypothetical protein [Candidatus Magasanikbacteria bacterium]